MVCDRGVGRLNRERDAPLRIVCPYTQLHPLTKRSLVAFAPDTDAIDLGNRHDAYYTILSELWAAGETFLIVEHDIEIHADVVPQLAACPQPWCVFPYYAADTLLDGSLGCTRFRSDVLRAIPTFMADLPVRDWRRLDCEMTPRLHTAGFEQHIHEPQVLHHHIREDGRCDCKGTHGEQG